MSDPRMSQNAARLSEDIGDVLSAIRRMIADDDALSHARDRVRSERGGLIQDDAGDFLARRYGGNAALARQLVETAARAPAMPEAVPAAVTADPEPQPAMPPFVLRAAPAAAADDAALTAPVPAAEALCDDAAPLRLVAERRVPEAPASRPSGWRAWLRSEPAEPQAPAEPVPSEPAPAASVSGNAVAAAPAEDDADDFAEAFDWKARMRPEIEEPASPAPVSRMTEPRLSGWASSPDPVARLAAEAAAFDAEMQAQAEHEAAAQMAALATAQAAEDQSIRDLLRDMVQAELNGALGERFSANLRTVIRREVAAAIDTYLDRF